MTVVLTHPSALFERTVCPTIKLAKIRCEEIREDVVAFTNAVTLGPKID